MAFRRTGRLAGWRLMAAMVAFGSLAIGGVQQLGTGVAHATDYGQGYMLFAQDGGTFAFGNVKFDGSIYSFGNPNNLNNSAQALLGHAWVGGAVTSDKGGYWGVTSNADICAFGDAAADTYPSTGYTYSPSGCWKNVNAITLNKPIVGMASAGAGISTSTTPCAQNVTSPQATCTFCPSGTQCSYWLVAADGGVFAFGNAKYYGSTGKITLNAPIVGMAATPDDKGYWLVGADGGVFAFGDATFYGSMGNKSLNAPIVGMAATPDGKGYWLVGADGGIFSFGDAHYYGSMGGTTLAEPVVSVIASSDGGGYLEAAADGGIFTFGDFAYQGAQSGDGHSSTNSPANAVVAVSGS